MGMVHIISNLPELIQYSKCYGTVYSNIRNAPRAFTRPHFPARRLDPAAAALPL